MGGVAQVNHDEYSLWTGGKPNYDWTGLNPDAYRAPIESTQYGPIKEPQTWGTTLSTKIAIGDDLSNFQKKIFEHLEMRGMDSIAYLPHPAIPTVMVNIVTDHTHFTRSMPTLQ